MRVCVCIYMYVYVSMYCVCQCMYAHNTYRTPKNGSKLGIILPRFPIHTNNTCTYTDIHHTYIHTHTHKNIHTYIHTYIHTHTQTHNNNTYLTPKDGSKLGIILPKFPIGMGRPRRSDSVGTTARNMYVCMYVCMCVCMCARACMYAQISYRNGKAKEER